MLGDQSAIVTTRNAGSKPWVTCLRPSAGDGGQAAVQPLHEPRRSAGSLERRWRNERVAMSDRPDTLSGITRDDGHTEGRAPGSSTGKWRSLLGEPLWLAVA